MTTQLIKQEMKDVLCKHCNICYPSTKEFFYTKYKKLVLDKCKECKKVTSKIYEKTRSPRIRTDRRQYFKDRRLKIKLAKVDVL